MTRPVRDLFGFPVVTSTEDYLGHTNRPNSLRDADLVHRLMAEHRCESCTGRDGRVEAEPDPEVESFWPAFLTLVICGFALVAWMFYAAAAHPEWLVR